MSGILFYQQISASGIGHLQRDSLVAKALHKPRERKVRNCKISSAQIAMQNVERNLSPKFSLKSLNLYNLLIKLT